MADHQRFLERLVAVGLGYLRQPIGRQGQLFFVDDNLGQFFVPPDPGRIRDMVSLAREFGIDPYWLGFKTRRDQLVLPIVVWSPPYREGNGDGNITLAQWLKDADGAARRANAKPWWQRLLGL